MMDQQRLFKHVSIDTKQSCWFPGQRPPIYRPPPLFRQSNFGTTPQSSENKRSKNGLSPALLQGHPTMLRITVLHNPEALTFRVEGKLVGQWAGELEQCWREAAAIRGHRALIVDLSETLFIDEQGRRILAKLFREGAFFRTAGPMTESIVAEITGKSKPIWPSIVAHSVLLLLLAIGVKGAQPA